MERTNEKQRKANAKSFFQHLQLCYDQRAAIVILHQDSKTNPNIHRVQLITRHINGPAYDSVIAESVDGVTGCFNELIRNIFGNIPQKEYVDSDFAAWLRKTCHMHITYNDGLVIMLEYKK